MAEPKKPQITFEAEGDNEIPVKVAEPTKQDQAAGFQIPREYVKLPSKGKIYSKVSSLYKAEEIEVRQMTAAEEDILTSRSLIRSGKAVDMVVSRCVCNKAVNVDDLLSGDKNAIMMALRVSGYGADYNISVTCPSCSEEADFEFDLSNLDVNELNLDPIEEGENKFTYKTKSNNEIEFKLLTSGEQKEISEYQANIKRAGGQYAQVDRNVTTRLKKQILSINGNISPKVISDYVDSMPVRDSREFRKFVDDNEPDIVMKQMFECISCGQRQEVDLPITVEFFWPE